MLLIRGAVREADADLRVAAHGEAGAVEAARAGAAVHIRHADIPLGDGHDGRMAGAAWVDAGAAASAAGAAAAVVVLRGCRVRSGLGRRGLLGLQAIDLRLEAGRHLLELVLQALDLGLVLRRGLDQLGGRLLVGVELDAPVLDVLLVGGDALDGVDVAVAEPLHDVELGHEVVEAVGRHQDVDDADVARPVHVFGARGELLVGDLEVVLGHLEQPLVLLDLRRDRVELGGGLVVLLHGHVDLVVHGLELGLHRAQLRFLAADGGGEGGGGENEGEKEGSEKDEESENPSIAVHCIASFWASAPAKRPR